MDEIVSSYPPHIHRIEPPHVVGTAFYPGGCGLWCGFEHFAPAPEFFPDSPAMIVAHNYSGAAAYRKLRAKGGEGGSWWRDRVIPLLTVAGIDYTNAFFTNALMGLRDGASTGSMNATKEFENECSLFLSEQIRIVNPSVIITFGHNAYSRLRQIVPSVAKCPHPSAWEFNPLVTRAANINARGLELRAEIALAQNDRLLFKNGSKKGS